VKLVTRLVACLALLGATACSATVSGTAAPTPAPTAGPAANPPPRPAFAAYLDAEMSFPDLATLSGQTGLKHVVLSFVLAKDGGCEPAWGGSEPMDSLKGSIESFRAVGGSVTVATGGAEGAYLENVCANPADLAAAYTKVLDATGTNLLDVDIEQNVKIDKVIEALGLLQRARGTDITLTLPTELDGLGPGQLNLVKKAAATKVDITVNIMDMNLDTRGDFGTAMVRAAQTVLTQLRKVYPNATKAEQYRRLGITMMIGRNDTGPITQLDDAQTVMEFAKTNGVGRLGMWSLARDFGTCPGRTEAQPDCSGIKQEDYGFTRTLAAFAGPTTD